MKFLIFVISCLAVAKASAIWGHGHHGAVVAAHGHDDGQWHGEGLWESHDWANHHHGVHGAHIVAPHVVGHHGFVQGHVAPVVVAAHGHHGAWVDHHHHW